MNPRETPRYLPLVLWVGGLSLIQGALDGHFPVSVTPLPILLFVLFLGIRFNTLHSLVVGFLLGTIRDAVTLSPFGLHALSFVLIGYLPHSMRRNFYLAGFSTRLFLVVLVTVVPVLAAIGVFPLLGKDLIHSWKGIHWRLFWHLILAWPLFFLWDISLRRIEPKKKKRRSLPSTPQEWGERPKSAP